jgi:hypothetical protein
MRKTAAIALALGLAFSAIAATGAAAQCTLPIQLTNGQTADATQVMANFTALANCINASVNTGTAGQVGTYATNGNTISGVNLTDLLDSSFGSTRGSILERGAGGWAMLQPGTSGTVLTSQGAGADPQYLVSGTGVRGLFSGQMSPVVPNQSATGISTWLNQGAATESDDDNGMYFTVLNNGGSNILRGLTGAAPTAPYSRTLLLQFNEVDAGAAYVSFGWYDGTAKAQTISYNSNGNRGIFNWNSPTSLQGLQAFNIPVFQFIWFRLEDDGTNYTMSYALDGVHFFTIASGAKSSGFLGATGYSDIFIGCDCYGGDGHFTVLSYQ